MSQDVRKPGADLVTMEILLNGSAMPDSYGVTAIRVSRALGRLPMAEITLADGSPSEEDFPASASGHFVPGQQVEIRLGYDAKNTAVFKGIILRQSLSIGAGGESNLVVGCGDKAAGLTVARRSRIFTGTSDSAALSKVIREAGLTADVAATSGEAEHLVQTDCTDWDFLLARAEVNAMVVDVAAGKVTVARPDFASPELSVGFGTSLDQMDLELDALNQLSGASAQSWDAKTQELVTATGRAPAVNTQGNLGSAALSKVLNVSGFALRSIDPLEQEQLSGWAAAQLLKSELARISGMVSFPGNAAVVPGKTLELKGLGTRFNGAGYVTGISHHMADGRWTTEAHFGLDRQWFTDSHRDATQPAAAARQPGTGGLQIAKVMQVYDDPAGGGRIKVSIPLQGSDDGIWVRLASPYAGSSMGITFLPEVGDEVIVGFLGNDPNAPVVLGALHSAKRPMPFTPEEQNNVKSIVTRSSLTMGFDDDKKVITVTTPGGHSITLSDEAKEVALKDSNGNAITMGESGISITTPKDLSLSATGKLSISGDAGISAKSPAQVTAEGGSISLTAETELSAEGGVSASVSGGGELTLSATMIMIN
ncbi:MAG: type VI secretion system tip protein VgrG [Paracoccaceae bacterium]